MNYSFISDIHIRNKNDEAAALFLSFLKNSRVQNSNTVFLLGDIFEFLVGERKSYIEEYSEIFTELISLMQNGVKVIFLEGNHDFHFEMTLKAYVKFHKIPEHLFEYRLDGDYISLNDKKYYFCHGDEVDYYNVAFKRWKRIYRSNFMKILVNKVLPYKVLSHIGHSASKDSKRRGNKTFDFEKAREKYRVGALALLEELDVDGIISGHTHIKEMYELKPGKMYINCGFPLRSKIFMYFNGESFEETPL